MKPHHCQLGEEDMLLDRQPSLIATPALSLKSQRSTAPVMLRLSQHHIFDADILFVSSSNILTNIVTMIDARSSLGARTAILIRA